MGMGVKGRVETVVRRATPAAAVPALVRRRTTRARASETERAEARRQMEFLLGVRAPEVDLEAVVDRYLWLMKWRGEARWHHDLLVHQPVEGLEHYEQARAAGRGVLVSFSHHGLYDGVFGSLGNAGVPCVAIVTPTMFDGTAPAWMMAQYRIGSVKHPMINANLGVRGFVERLEQGAVLGLATDVPGTKAMSFLGRDVKGSFGLAHIAHKYGVPVVQVSAVRLPDDGPHPHQKLVISPVIDPADHDGPQSILDRVVAGLEEAVLAWPEAYDQPLKRWTWEPSAHPASPAHDG